MGSKQQGALQTIGILTYTPGDKETTGGFVKICYGFPGPAPRICDSSGLGCEWLICISESFQVTLLLVLQDNTWKTTGDVLINKIPERVGGMPE